jgi:hypothetical protein
MHVQSACSLGAIQVTLPARLLTGGAGSRSCVWEAATVGMLTTYAPGPRGTRSPACAWVIQW